MVAFIDIRLFSKHLQGDMASRGRGVLILQAREFSCDQGKEIRRLPKWIYPARKMTAIKEITGCFKVAI